MVRRLEQVGGTEFVGRLRVHKDLAVGSAVVTGGGGDLPAEFVIHAVIRSDTEPVSATGVARAWLSALHQAQEWEFAHLTVPPRARSRAAPRTTASASAANRWGPPRAPSAPWPPRSACRTC